MNKKLSHLLEPSFELYFFSLIAFALVTAFFNLYLAAAEGAIVALLGLYYRHTSRRRKREITKYINNLTGTVDVATKDNMVNSPLPMLIFRPESGDIIWSNDRFLHLTGDPEHLFETSLSTLIPDFPIDWLLDGKTICPETVPVGNQRYLVYGNLVSTGHGQEDFLATTYWVDVTDYARTAEDYTRTRPILAIVQIDNYEDLVKGIDEGDRSMLWMKINNLLSDWTEAAQGMICRYDRDHYLLFVESERFQELQRKKFSILEGARKILSPNGVAVTLSIGIGMGGDNPKQLYDFACLALDMALSRGGDQAVIKDGLVYSFIGGRAKETERRTKVKSRVMATAMGEQLSAAHSVVIMGHRMPDVDVMGATAGVVAMARKLGVPVRIVRAPAPTPPKS